MKIRKLVAVLLVILLSVSAFAGGSKEAASGDVTLTVLWFNDANESDVFMDTMQDYLEANPNVKIDLQVIAFGDYEQKLKMMISGGNPPDVARLTTSHVPILASSLEPIDPYLEDPAATKAESW